MPWWSWVLIWVALSACTVTFLVLAGVYLVRKGLALMRDASAALGEIAERPPAAEGPAHDHEASPSRRAPGSAVFADPDLMRREYEEGRELRRLSRRDRRVERRRLRGQPQSLHDLGLI
ncbi:hypothetical protein [Sinomonas flava]|uniref:Uncharacterized protein n=1 Tax=Sinomonas flava TaxID=496857 RepID=A0ABN3BL18_9MICC